MSMYLITNRTFTEAEGLKVFGKTPNTNGPNELRLIKVSKANGEWDVEPVADCLAVAEVEELKREYGLDVDSKERWHGSLAVACDIFSRARKEKKSILFFVHGYNNDVEDVLSAAREIESLYNVIVVPFTWPANGGGAISGTASYLSDKSDARASAGALDRAVAKIQQFHKLLTCGQNKRLQSMAADKHPDNPMAASALYAELSKKECSVKISLLCHSMGSYVFKHTLSTSENSTSQLVFDNICLVAADTNNKDHAEWVGKLDVRKRIYIVINENDLVLMASRVKPGKEQKARLGHYTKQLNSPNASYIDVTDRVGPDHTYFKGVSVEQDSSLRDMFEAMFNGESVEEKLKYRSDNNTYKL